MNNNILGDQIKSLRTAKKMTLSVMAERVGVKTSSIASYESGARTPSVEVLVKIAQLFRVSTDNLLGYSNTFSNKYSLDITDLNQRQRNTIQDIVTTYKRHNCFVKNVNENYVFTKLKELGLEYDSDDLPVEY